MWNVILAILVTIFALFGFTEFLRCLVFRFYKPKKEQSVMVIFADENCVDDIEYTLRSTVTRAKWLGKAMPQSIVVVDRGLDKVSRRICKNICKDYDYIALITEDELYGFLSKKNT